MTFECDLKKFSHLKKFERKGFFFYKKVNTFLSGGHQGGSENRTEDRNKNSNSCLFYFLIICPKTYK